MNNCGDARQQGKESQVWQNVMAAYWQVYGFELTAEVRNQLRFEYGLPLPCNFYNE